MTPRAYIVVGLGFGDEGKGTIVDHLVSVTGAQLVVRYSGGPQSSHAVVLPDGRFHRFSQFGSGSFHPGVMTYLAGRMLIEPYALLNEAITLGEGLGIHPTSLLGRIIIDRRCAVITPFHWLLNRARETARGRDRHGSCGMGIGELRAWREQGGPELHFGDLSNREKTRRILSAIRHLAFQELAAIYSGSDVFANENIDYIADRYFDFSKLVRSYDYDVIRLYLKQRTVIFEGNQGVLLDEDYGWVPYNTWASTTAKYAKEIVADAGIEARTIGVLRTFMTRHGPGPFVSEHPNLGALAYDDHNQTNEWQGALRVGLFDAVAIRYALKCCPVDELALTHLDKVGSPSRYVAGYLEPHGIKPIHALKGSESVRALNDMTPVLSDTALTAREWIDSMHYMVGASVKHISWGPTRREKKSFELGGTELPEEFGIKQLQC